MPSICGCHKAITAAMYCTGTYRGLAFKLLFVALDVYFDVNTIRTLILSSTLATQTTNPNERVQSAWDSLIKNIFNFHCQVQFLDAFQFAVPNFFCHFLGGNGTAFFADLIGPKNSAKCHMFMKTGAL